MILRIRTKILKRFFNKIKPSKKIDVVEIFLKFPKEKQATKQMKKKSKRQKTQTSYGR